ncbi:uncharacterized protein PHACADRAFT_257284, partial [Phanerochaete carnosa HHB-10118-sp]
MLVAQQWAAALSSTVHPPAEGQAIIPVVWAAQGEPVRVLHEQQCMTYESRTVVLANLPNDLTFPLRSPPFLSAPHTQPLTRRLSLFLCPCISAAQPLTIRCCRVAATMKSHMTSVRQVRASIM